MNGTFIDLFCGGGGMRQGFEEAGYRCVFANDIDRFAAAVYRRHYNDDTLTEGDIRGVPLDLIPDRADWLAAGFPCQSFSISGAGRGFEDARGTLFFDIARICKHKKPANVLLENVLRLLTHDGGRTFNRIVEVLEECGYFVEWGVLNAAKYGPPQSRSRVIIVGHSRIETAGALFLQPGNGGVYHDVDPEKVATCLDASYAKGWLDNGQRTHIFQDGRPRRLTPLECERLMGFPDDWTAKGLTTTGKEIAISDRQRYKIAGNAVVPAVIADVVRRTGEFKLCQVA